jgi:hypothetical protein
MNLKPSLLGLSLLLVGSTLSAAPTGSDLIGNEPLPTIAQTTASTRVYRITCPLRQNGKTLTVFLALPSSADAKANNATNPTGYAIDHSLLKFAVFNGDQVEEQGAIPVESALFRKIMVSFVESEVFSLPERQSELDNFIKVTAMDSGKVVAERFDGTTVHRVERVYGESVPVNHLANEIQRAIGKAAAKTWANETP